jgi:hypothetical protein
MPETLLANGEVVQSPKTFRLCITLPYELKSFIETRARAPKYRSRYTEANVSAYARELFVNDFETFGPGRPRARRNGKAVRRARE